MSIDPRTIDPRAFGVPSAADDEPAQALAEDSARALWKRDAASQAMGLRLEEVGPGRATMLMTVRADMVNGHGTCHGGFIFALADSCFGYACNSHNRVTVAAAGQIDFLAPAFEGDRLSAVAEQRSRGGRTGIYDVTVFNAAGKTVALFRARSHEVKG